MQKINAHTYPQTYVRSRHFEKRNKNSKGNRLLVLLRHWQAVDVTVAVPSG